MHVPVWHAKAQELVAAGELSIVGIVHEQHPDRAALYAQWQGFDFPLLWDPFGVTGLKVVPVVSAIDPGGVVRLARPDPRKFESQFLPDFMGRTFESAAVPAPPGFVISELGAGGSGHGNSLARIVLGGVGKSGPAAADLAAVMGVSASASPFERFCAGVAHRLRYDGGAPVSDDFQAALDHWGAALQAQPNQYIWRRRIQQWGPRLDKPYPFYDWIDTAVSEVSARGETAVHVVATLSGSEVAGKSKKVPGARGSGPVEGAVPRPIPEPDAGGKVTRDPGKLVGLELAVAPHTASAGGSVRSPMGSSRVHVTLRPKAGAKWPLDAEPPIVWLDLPDGWNAAASAFAFPMPVAGGEAAALTADFELSTSPIPLGPPDENASMPASSVPGYAVYSICLEDGTCVFRRQDLTVQVKFPGPPDKR